MKKTLAIIGTAGRGEDGEKLTLKHWYSMIDAAKKVIEIERITNLVSGGAAWADGVAVELSSKLQLGLPLNLWLPEVERDLETAKKYHTKFAPKIGSFDTWNEVLSCENINYFGGFKDRNSKVAEEADIFIAMTFGNGKKVKDGGTLDTVNKMIALGKTGYHLDLNSLKLYHI